MERSIFEDGYVVRSEMEVVAIMCSIYRMDDKNWVAKWAQDAESMINLMPAYQMAPVRYQQLMKVSFGRF